MKKKIVAMCLIAHHWGPCHPPQDWGRTASSSTRRDSWQAGGARTPRTGRDSPRRGRRQGRGDQGRRCWRARPCSGAGGRGRACSGRTPQGAVSGPLRGGGRRRARWGRAEHRRCSGEVWRGRLREVLLAPDQASHRYGRRWGRRLVTTTNDSKVRVRQILSRKIRRRRVVGCCSGRAGRRWPCRRGGCRDCRLGARGLACRWRGGTWLASCSRTPCLTPSDLANYGSLRLALLRKSSSKLDQVSEKLRTETLYLL